MLRPRRTLNYYPVTVISWKKRKWNCCQQHIVLLQVTKIKFNYIFYFSFYEITNHLITKDKKKFELKIYGKQ